MDPRCEAKGPYLLENSENPIIVCPTFCDCEGQGEAIKDHQVPLAPMMACTTEPPNPQTQSSSLLQRDVFAGITPAPHLNSGPLVRLHDVVRNFRKPIIRHIEVS